VINLHDRKQTLLAREQLAAVTCRLEAGSPEHQAMLTVLAAINDALYVGVEDTRPATRRTTRSAQLTRNDDAYAKWLKEHGA